MNNDLPPLAMTSNVKPIEVTVSHVRHDRDQLLQAVDRVNPIWYSSLSDQQQLELQTYRQELLDVPMQAGFPIDVVWPAKPTWLA